LFDHFFPCFLSLGFGGQNRQTELGMNVNSSNETKSQNSKKGVFAQGLIEVPRAREHYFALQAQSHLERMETLVPPQGWRDLSSSSSSPSNSSISSSSEVVFPEERHAINRNDGEGVNKNRLKKPLIEEEISSSGIFYKMMGEGALTSLGVYIPGGRGPAFSQDHNGTSP
jgi:hypothetical protein